MKRLLICVVCRLILIREKLRTAAGMTWDAVTVYEEIFRWPRYLFQVLTSGMTEKLGEFNFTDILAIKKYSVLNSEVRYLQQNTTTLSLVFNSFLLVFANINSSEWATMRGNCADESLVILFNGLVLPFSKLDCSIRTRSTKCQVYMYQNCDLYPSMLTTLLAKRKKKPSDVRISDTLLKPNQRKFTPTKHKLTFN